MLLTIATLTERKRIGEMGGSEWNYAEYYRGKGYILLSRLPGSARWSFWRRYTAGKVEHCEMKTVEW